MRNLRLTLLAGRLSFRALFSWNTPSLFFSVLVITPILQMLFFVLLGSSLDYKNGMFFVIGASLQGATSASVAGLVGVIAEERRFGTLTFLMLSPASRIAVFVGKLLPGLGFAAGVSIFTSTLGFLVAGWPMDLTKSLEYFLVILAASFSGAALGLMLSAFGLIYRDIFQIASAMQFVLLLVTGATVDSVDLPRWVQIIGQGMPLTHAIEAARGLANNATGTHRYLVLMLSEILVGLFWLFVALCLMKLLEVMAKRDATIELY